MVYTTYNLDTGARGTADSTVFYDDANWTTVTLPVVQFPVPPKKQRCVSVPADVLKAYTPAPKVVNIQLPVRERRTSVFNTQACRRRDYARGQR